ncbi:reverse transcriptase domain-containing protein [Tanacetum coccineum]
MNALEKLTCRRTCQVPESPPELRRSWRRRYLSPKEPADPDIHYAEVILPKPKQPTHEVVKCYNCQGEGHMARQCTQPKRPRNAAWYKEKAMLAEAQEAGQILDEEQLAFLADPGIPASQAQTVIPHNAAFQTEDLDTYDSDCVPNSETYLNDMDNQSVLALQDFEQSPVMDFTDNEISSDSNIIPYSQYLQETQQATVQDTNLQAQQDSMILSMIE